MESVALHFQPQEFIVAYLTQHESLVGMSPWLAEKKVIETVAKHFANSKKLPEMIEFNVILAMRSLSLGLEKDDLKGIHYLLAEALKDCARASNA